MLAGAAEANVSETIKACELYHSYGARAVAIVSPYYYKLSPESVFAYFREISRVWADLELIPHEYRELDGGEIVVFGRMHARALGGYVVDEPAQWVFRLRAGKITWVAAFANKDDALEAAGAPAGTA